MSEIRKCLESLSYPFLNAAAAAAAAKTAKALVNSSSSQSGGSDFKSTDALVKAQLADKVETESNELKLQEMARHFLSVDLKFQQFFVDEEVSDNATTTTSTSRPFHATSGKNALIALLVESLEKRFKFHFFGNRKTNNLEKVTQITCE